MLNRLELINPGNKAVEFIKKRVADDKYRGSLSIQHTVYDLDKIVLLLKTLNKFAPNKQLLRIRTADLSKRPSNTPEEIKYASFVNAFSRLNNSDTQDTIRKNIFPDLHRMGLIHRYDKNKELINPYKQASVVYVSLADQGLKLIHADTLDQRFIWSKSLDQVLGGLIETMLGVLRDNNYTHGSITKWEYMFFVSAIDLDSDKFSFSITQEECIALINEFRRLSKFHVRQLIDIMRNEMKPENYTGDKTKQRDFHNWRNKNDRIFERFAQTVYFQVNGKDKDSEVCVLSTKKIKTRRGKIVEIRKRSLAEKHKYWDSHNINKKIPGFELHHVIALSFSESPEQFDMFDNWQNMVYIDAFSHARITQNKNRNIIMSARNDDIILKDHYGNEVLLRNKINLAYNSGLQDQLVSYNETLRTTL